MTAYAPMLTKVARRKRHPRGPLRTRSWLASCDAKAHLSALVDQAEHKKKRILILRHGKPAAAIVPVRGARRGSVSPWWGGFRGERPRSPRVNGVQSRQPERSPEVIATKSTPEGRSRRLHETDTGVGGCTLVLRAPSS
jgi:prevent-host-death family protein